MKKILNFCIITGALLIFAPSKLVAVTTFFTDDFTHGSTTNGVSVPGGTPTASYTSYDIASTKNTIPGTNGASIAPNQLRLALTASTSSGWVECQALFATNGVALSSVGDYIEMTVVFTNTAGTLLQSGTASAIWVGLFNSSGNPPVAGNLANSGLTKTDGSAYATGNCATWKGYDAQITSGGTIKIYTRPIQDGSGTTSANQELFGDSVGSGAFNNPRATNLVSATGPTVTLTADAPYTLVYRITLADVNSLTISNTLYDGVGTGGTILSSQVATNGSGANYIGATFDGMGIGVFHKNSPNTDPTMDIASITIVGESTVVTTPPTITSQPVPVTVPVGGSCVFSVAATGFGVQYQWHRNGTNLVDDGNISGSTSSTLTISPVSADDAATGANGYYVTVSGTGGYSTNSTTNSLTLGTAADLIWSGGGSVWDLGTSANWLSNGVATTFNYGDSVTIDDSAGYNNTIVNLSGSYLSASSVTVNSSYDYILQGSGSFAGPGTLIYEGAGHLTINNANAYSGGTIISNASAYLVLNNYAGLGTGPLTLVQGNIEVVPTGSTSTGFGDVNVADDFTITFDGTGAYAGVFQGNLSGTAGKTLSLNQLSLSTTNRYRVYGTHTTNDANIAINGPSTSQANYYGTTLAPYNSSGVQIYNGVISGNGGIVQRANGSTILNGANTYAGGTTPTTGAIGLGIDTVGSVTSGPIGTGPLFLAPEVPNATGSGQIFASGGAHTVANPLQYPSATNNLTLLIGGTNNLTLSGAYTLNGNDGLGTYTNRTIQVTNTGLTTLSGVISDNGAGFGLTKTGNGVLALSNTETYTGPTLVSGGKLLVNGSLNAASTVTATNGVIGGSGTINGAVTIQSGGGVSPGNSIGTLTINNSLTIQGGSTNTIEVNKQASTKDLVTVTGNITYGGTLFATNLAGTVTTSDTFQVFSVSGTKTGTFTNIIGSPGSGLAWSFNPTNGTLSVVASVNTNPTNIVVSVSSGNINLSWPTDHIGWSLQVQTNSLSTGLGTNWVDVPNSSAVNSTNFPINPANGAVFYRLIYH